MCCLDEYSFVGETEEEEMNDLDFDDIGMDEISDIEIENRPKLLQAHEHSFMAQKQGPPPGGPLPGGQPPGGQKLPQALPLVRKEGINSNSKTLLYVMRFRWNKEVVQ